MCIIRIYYTCEHLPPLDLSPLPKLMQERETVKTNNSVDFIAARYESYSTMSLTWKKICNTIFGAVWATYHDVTSFLCIRSASMTFKCTGNVSSGGVGCGVFMSPTFD